VGKFILVFALWLAGVFAIVMFTQPNPLSVAGLFAWTGAGIFLLYQGIAFRMESNHAWPWVRWYRLWRDSHEWRDEDQP
jgi:hypothetical protein